jgi:hypothetical protein
MPLSEAFKHLHKFVSSVMRMTHVYQPVMIQTLLAHEGRATVRVHGGDKPGHWIVGDVPMRAV